LLKNRVSDMRSLIKGNIRVLATRDLILTISVGTTGGLDSLFVMDVLGADAISLGFLASVWSVVFLLFILTGGMISKRYDRKKTLISGMALTLPNPLIFAIAQDWRIIIVANVLGALGTSLAAPAYVALLFSSSEQTSRSRSIAVMNTLTSLANTIVPPIGAFLIQWLGGLEKIRLMFLFQFFLSIMVLLYTAKKLERNPSTNNQELNGFSRSFKDVLGQIGRMYSLSKERKSRSWLLLALTGPWAWEVVGPFWTIYAAETCRTPINILGFLPAFYSLTGAALLLPLAEISDKKGRKKVILLTRPFLYVCMVILLSGGTFRDWTWVPLIPLLAWVFRAVGDASGPSWTAASTEVIPEELQGEWEATRDFLWRVMAIPASLLGGILWTIDSRLPFLLALLVDSLLRFPALIYLIPETLIRPRQLEPLGPHIIVYGLPASGKTSVAHLIGKELPFEVLDEDAIRKQEGKDLATTVPFGNGKEEKTRKLVREILAQKSNAVLIEGEPAVFAADARDEGMVILLVASKDERVRRESAKSRSPDFVVLKDLEKADRKLTRLARRLYGVDMSKLPPFDIAINTDRIPPEKIAEIVSLIRRRPERKTDEGSA